MTSDPVISELARRFELFADVECRGLSPLYEHLSLHVARTPALLEIASHSREGQAPPNLLLAATHLLLAQEGDPALVQYYASLVEAHRPPDAGLGAAFEAFCLRHRDALVHLVSTRLVQTNEPTRSAALRLGLGEVARVLGTGAFALVEVGASAGLNLNFDAYRIDYGHSRVVGPAAGVPLATDLRPGSLAVPAEAPAVPVRVGLDLAPIDPTDAESAAWLRALVWPEDRERLRTLDAALTTAAAHPPRLVAGDAVLTLAEVVEGLAAGMPVCVFHSATLAHLPAPRRAEFVVALHRLAETREVAWLSMEGARLLDQYPPRADAPGVAGGYLLLGLTDLRAGQSQSRSLAAVNPHGRWIEWWDGAMPGPR